MNECAIRNLPWAMAPTVPIWFVGEADAVHADLDDAYVIDTWIVGIGDIVVIYGVESVAFKV